MSDNFNDDIMETLVKYADNELNTDEQQAVERLLQNNIELKERYQNLIIAKQATRSLGIKKRVQRIHSEFMQEAKPVKEVKTKVINSTSFFKTFMRVAAVFFIAVAGYGVFLYSSTSNQSEYDNNFITYYAATIRGNESVNTLSAIYNNGNYNEVIKSLSAIQNKTQQDYFIAAQSYLQLNKTTDAINAFKAMEDLNNNSSQKYFEQETDYYLMLAYIKNGGIKLAEQKLDKITSNKQHLFYNKAKNKLLLQSIV